MSSLIDKINALKAITEKGTVSPVYVGNLLAHIVNALEQRFSSIVHPVRVEETPDADLVITDENKFPILTVHAGHIRTMHFDSASIVKDILDEAEKKIPKVIKHPVSLVDTTKADFIIADEDRKPIFTIDEGHIKTAKFNTKTYEKRLLELLKMEVPPLVKLPISMVDTDLGDLVIADSKRRPLLILNDGHIRTAKFNSKNLAATASPGQSVVSSKKQAPGKWLAVGTSVTYWDGVDIRTGYQTFVKEHFEFSSYENLGVWGGSATDLAKNLTSLKAADYVTIEHGINDLGQGTPIGSIDDFIDNTGPNTFFGAYRKIIGRLYELNPNVLIILITPVKATGTAFNIPERWWMEANGHYLKEYVDAIFEIAEFCSFPVADVFGKSNINDWNLNAMCQDKCIHPNTDGHRRMSKPIIEAFNLIV